MISYNLFLLKSTYFSESLLKGSYRLIIPLTSNRYQSSYYELKKLNNYVKHLFLFYWARVSFRGKGFRLRKFKRITKLTCNFGHSHWSKLALDSTILFFKKLKRQNYICIAKNPVSLKCLKNQLKTIKKLNVYTKRGLRLRRQLVRRRFGKISQVVSSLH